MSTVRVAVVVSHPIQHFCPQYTSWSVIDDVSLRVFFASRSGLTAYKDKNFDRVVQWEGINLDFPHEFLPGAEHRELGTDIDAPGLEARLEAFRPDVIVGYGYSQPLQRRVIDWSKATNTPIFMILDSELRSPRSHARRLAKAALLPRILKRIDRFLTVGDANEAYLRNYGVTDERFVRCFFPIDVNALDKVLTTRDLVRKQVREAYEIPEDHHVVLKVGKFVSWKRQIDLVECSNQLDAANKVTVVLAGTGPEEAKLRARAKRQGVGGVLFAGFVPPAKLFELYCASDIYVHCSEVEPHSLAISEAIYCGLPVVVSSHCGSYGPSDDVRTGLNGIVYPCADVGALSRAITSIVSSPQRRTEMGAASAEIARIHQRLAHGRALRQAIDSLPTRSARP